MTAYYNDNDPYCAQWLRNLIGAGLIPHGDVDERSIRDVAPSDVGGYAQVHFFAGLGGWAYAARLAGWPDDRPLWTGSCPCQPFSVAGKQLGFADPRDLWPVWFRLIAQCRPATIAGEQVAKASDWLRRLRGDLATLDYAMGAIPVEAASAGADHFRDRYWFVADSHSAELRQQPGWRAGTNGPGTVFNRDATEESSMRSLAYGHGERSQIAFGEPSDAGAECATATGSGVRSLVDAQGDGWGDGWGEGWTESEFRRRGFTAAVASIDGCQYVECPDGKWRRLPPPRVRWLGVKIPARVAKLRAFGNTIDPHLAAQILRAYLEGPI